MAKKRVDRRNSSTNSKKEGEKNGGELLKSDVNADSVQNIQIDIGRETERGSRSSTITTESTKI